MAQWQSTRLLTGVVQVRLLPEEPCRHRPVGKDAGLSSRKRRVQLPLAMPSDLDRVTDKIPASWNFSVAATSTPKASAVNSGSSPARQAGDGGSTPPGRTIRRCSSAAELLRVSRGRAPETEEIAGSIPTVGSMPPPEDGTRRYERRREGSSPSGGTSTTARGLAARGSEPW